MREVIIETDAMIRFDSAVDEVAGADRMLSGFVLAYGQAGRGKSVAADRYHYQRGGAYVRVWQGWSQTAFLQRLLFEVRGKNMDMPRHTGNRCKELVVQLLEAEPKPIFIDEADRLRIDRIEDLRDIHEMTGAPVVLIGEEGIFGLLHERRRIWSRIAYEVEFGPVSPAEIALYAQQAAGLDLPLSLSTEIAQKTEGDFPAGTQHVPLAGAFRQGLRELCRGPEDAGHGPFPPVRGGASRRRYGSTADSHKRHGP